MIEYRLHETDQDLRQILQLQYINLKNNLSQEEKSREGFVTIQHNLKILRSMGAGFRHVLAVDNDLIVGYALVMIPSMIRLLPGLESLVYESSLRRRGDRNLGEVDFLVMGQICIDKNYRGQGLFKGLYTYFRECYQRSFAAVITEVSIHNVRSLRAHQKIGFREISRHKSEIDEWIVLEWEWMM